jgi:hypothetical protein
MAAPNKTRWTIKQEPFMKKCLLFAVISAMITLGGCGGGTGPADTGVGDPSYVPSGAGGEGSGPTGTGGSTPGENPGAGLPGDNGTGN